MVTADIMIWAMALALVGALGATAYSVWHSLRANKRHAVENGVPASVISWTVMAIIVIVALPTLIIGSFTDMCLLTAAVMLIVATATVIYDKLKKRSVQTQKTK